MNTTIGVIGNGVVGGATARCFMEWGEVRVWDQNPARSTHKIEDVTACDVAFVCVPEKEVASAVCHFAKMGIRERAVVAVRSTTPVGTVRKVSKFFNVKNIVHYPEFLTARCATTDAQLPARNVLGFVNDPSDCDKLTNLLLKRFPGVPTHRMTAEESEAVKIFQNSFFAVKVAFFNEINALAVKLGLNWGRVRAAVLADGRIAHSHTNVPGPDGLYGFGGACLPKDLRQLSELLTANEGGDVYNHLCAAALERNNFDRMRGVVHAPQVPQEAVQEPHEPGAVSDHPPALD